MQIDQKWVKEGSGDGSLTCRVCVTAEKKVMLNKSKSIRANDSQQKYT